MVQVILHLRQILLVQDSKKKYHSRKQVVHNLCQVQRVSLLQQSNALSKMGENKNFAKGLVEKMEEKMNSLITTETVTSLNKRTAWGEG